MEKKKKFEIPEAILITFYTDDVIVTSNNMGYPGYGEDPQDEFQR